MVFIFSVFILFFSLSLNGMDEKAAVEQDVFAVFRKQWIKESEAAKRKLDESQAVHAQKSEELRKEFPAQSAEFLRRVLAGGCNKAELDQIQNLLEEQHEEHA